MVASTSSITSVFLVLFLLVCNTNNVSAIHNTEVITIAWNVITEIYKYWGEQKKEVPIPYLMFYNDKTKRFHRMPVAWNQDNFIDASDMTETPLQNLKNAIPDLLLGYKRYINPKTCNLFYRHLDGDIPINSNEIITNMLKLEPDLKNKYRQIFVRCQGIQSCTKNICDAVEITQEEDEIILSKEDKENIQYQLALNAFRHTKAHQIKTNNDKIELYEEELEGLGMDEFETESDTVQMIDQNLTMYKERLEKMATAFGWNEKLKEATIEASESKNAFEADKKVIFDKKTWTLSGYVVRFASFLNDAGDKISYTTTTSKFKYVVPDTQREESFFGKYLTGSGTVSKKFVRIITYLMEAEQKKSSAETLYQPKPHQFIKNS